MNTETLRIVGQVAGIGGLALGVFLLLFQSLLKKLRGPAFSRTQWFSIVRLFMWLVWSIAVIGMTAWILSAYLIEPTAENRHSQAPVAIPVQTPVTTTTALIQTPSTPQRVEAGDATRVVVHVSAASTENGRLQRSSLYTMQLPPESGESKNSPAVIEWLGADPYSFGLPALDIKLINNTDKTVFFTDIVISDISSTPDNRPELKWSSFLNYHWHEYPLLIHNDGWGAVFDVKLVGDVSRTSFFRNKKDVSIEIDNISTEAAIPLPEIFKDAFGQSRPRVGGTFHLVGTLYYSYLGPDNKRIDSRASMRVEVENYDPGVGAPMPPTYAYDAYLQVDKEGYTINCPISQALKPKDVDRFILSIGAAQSSFHQFQVSMLYNNNNQVSLGAFRLHLYLPRSKAGSVEHMFPDNSEGTNAQY